MLSLKSLIGIKASPGPERIKPFASRLGDMIEADRSATGDHRFDLRHVTEPQAKSLGRGVVREQKPARNAKSGKLTTQGKRTQAKASNTTSPATKPAAPEQQCKPVAEETSLEIMDLNAARILSRLESGSMERFKQFAKTKSLSVARNKTRDGFLNKETQKFWLVWKESETQCLVQGLGAFKGQLSHARQALAQIQDAPIATSGSGQELSDMTIIVKRLALMLHRAAPDSTLPDKAINYLKRHGLLDQAVEQ